MASLKAGLKMLRAIVFAMAALAVAGGASLSSSAADRFADYDLAMFQRPEFPEPERLTAFPEDLKELWLKALQRGDAQLRRMLIDALANAHRRGMPGIKETQSRLVALLDQPDQQLAVIRACAATLIELDAREQDATLAKLASRHGLSVAQIVEPALASWKSTAMQETWLQRISDAGAGRTSMLLAIGGLGQLRSMRASQSLGRMVNNTNETVGVRIAAARALGKTQTSELAEMAEQLVNASSPSDAVSALIAIELLSYHDDPVAIELLGQLADHKITAVQSRALEQLFEVDTALVDRRALQAMQSTDVNVRRWAVRAMVAAHDRGRIVPLCRLLDDVNPTLRRDVRDGLLELAKDSSLRQEVIAETMKVLRRDAWPSCEQACVVLARLDHEEAGPRMVELLGHERGEVKVAAAWGLTQLRVESLLPDMLDHAQSVLDGFRSGQLSDRMPGASLHVAHLFIAMGDQTYRPADPLLREYLPRNFTLGIEARAAAAWAIGLLFENETQEDLIETLVDRLNDVGGPLRDAEWEEVRQMCAVSLGRINAQSALGDLRKHAGSGGGTPGACSWAIERMTGEKPPPTKPAVKLLDNWFLVPLGEMVD